MTIIRFLNLNTHLLNIYETAFDYVRKNKTYLLIIAFAIILIRFFWLIYINWQFGELSNGMSGIKLWLDSDRYLSGADSIINGEPLVGRQIQFIGYMLFIAAIKLLNLPIEYVAVFQVLIAIIAAYALYDLAKSLSNSKIAGFVAASLFLANPFIVSWHIYILTESLYTSFVILSFWSLSKVILIKKLKYYLLSVLILLITMFIRPNGWILFPIFLCVYIVSFNLKKLTQKLAIASVLLVFVGILASVSLFQKSIEITTPTQIMKKGVVVWGHDELNIKMPQDSVDYRTAWTSGFKYVLRHPLACIKLAAYRVGYTLIHIRPYHSVKYKLRVLFWIIPAYLLTIIGILKYRKKTITKVGIFIILGHLLVVALTYAEHDSRFDVYILPVFYLFAGLGVYALVERFWNRFKSIKLDTY